jgi:nucleotide-binding universal stress UspA family protein
MYKKIMVPLDGSELAECVAPHVESIVKGCHVPEVFFVRAVEPVHLPVGTLTNGGSIFSEKDAERARKATDEYNVADARKYLNEFASRNKYDNASVQTALLTGKAAETLADYAEKNGFDLIIMSTHGRSGISRWVWGSTADKVLRSACVPVLMVRAPGCVPGI